MNNKYLHGAVLLLEENDNATELTEKCQQMRELGLNTIVIWPPCFYQQGKRDYKIQQLLLDCAAKENLQVIIELTGQVANLEYLPDSDYDPDYAVTNPDGSIALMQNGLGEFNYNHPVVKEKISTFFQETVAVFKDHPAVYAWDIWNETHFKSHDQYTLNLFQKYLQNKYQTIDNLNAIWKKSYSDFTQIRLDPITWAAIAPDCDWEEFRTDNLAAIVAEWAQIIRTADPNHLILADNVMSNAVWSEFDRGSDDWKLNQSIDCLGISFYPKTGGRLLPINTPWLRQLTFAAAASAGGGKFMVAEMQSHCYSEIFTCERVSPDELIDWNLEALFQGSVGNIYWKWEPFKTGFQLGGRGLVLADGSLSKRAQAIAEISKFLEKYPDLLDIKPVCQAAVLYDRKSNFAVKAINNRIRGIIGDDQCAQARFGVAKTAYERNVQLAVITPEQIIDQGLNQYSLLFLPYQLVMTTELANGLQRFVTDGGIIAANWPCGDIDENGRLYKQIPGGLLNNLIGARQTDSITDYFGAEEIELQELEIFDQKTEIRLTTQSGLPLLLRKSLGKGYFLYFATDLWNKCFAADMTACSYIYWEEILALGNFAFIYSSLPAVYAQSKESDYLLVNNEEGVSEGLISINRPAELIFGQGKLERIDTGWLLHNPRHAVISLQRDDR